MFQQSVWSVSEHEHGLCIWDIMGYFIGHVKYPWDVHGISCKILWNSCWDMIQWCISMHAINSVGECSHEITLVIGKNMWFP